VAKDKLSHTVMASRTQHLLRLAIAALVAAVICIAPIPVTGLGPLQPTVAAIAFTVLAHYLGVASWLLVLALPFLFFGQSAALFYWGSGSAASDDRLLGALVGTLLFSPITLVGPLIAGPLAYVIARSVWPNKSIERTRAE
jgi:hypothetical protein